MKTIAQQFNLPLEAVNLKLIQDTTQDGAALTTDKQQQERDQAEAARHQGALKFLSTESRHV